MPGSRSSNDPEHKSPRESGEDSEDESEILEESPCGRWLKRREEVSEKTKYYTIQNMYLLWVLCIPNLLFFFAIMYVIISIILLGLLNNRPTNRLVG